MMSSFLIPGKQLAVQKIAEAVCEVFDTKGDMVECKKIIKNWFEGLDPAQRNASPI